MSWDTIRRKIEALGTTGTMIETLACLEGKPVWRAVLSLIDRDSSGLIAPWTPASPGQARRRESGFGGASRERSVRCCTAVWDAGMVKLMSKDAEEARNQLPDLLDSAEQGRSTIITRHGRPVAALVPIGAHGAAARQQPLMSVAGSGRGLWGRNSARTLRKLRDERSR